MKFLVRGIQKLYPKHTHRQTDRQTDIDSMILILELNLHGRLSSIKLRASELDWQSAGPSSILARGWIKRFHCLLSLPIRVGI